MNMNIFSSSLSYHVSDHVLCSVLVEKCIQTFVVLTTAVIRVNEA